MNALSGQTFGQWILSVCHYICIIKQWFVSDGEFASYKIAMNWLWLNAKKKILENFCLEFSASLLCFQSMVI